MQPEVIPNPFELSSKAENRHSIIFVNPRTDIIPDPSTNQIPEGTQKVDEMEGIPLANRQSSRNNLNLETFELRETGIYRSCKDCRLGRHDSCGHLKSMGKGIKTIRVRQV